MLGTDRLVMPTLVSSAVDVMGTAYPDVVKNRDFIEGVMEKEEERFRHTLKTGLGILDGELDRGEQLSGSTAFLCMTPTASRSNSPRKSLLNGRSTLISKNSKLR